MYNNMMLQLNILCKAMQPEDGGEMSAANRSTGIRRVPEFFEADRLVVGLFTAHHRSGVCVDPVVKAAHTCIWRLARLVSPTATRVPRVGCKLLIHMGQHGEHTGPQMTILIVLELLSSY